MDNGCMPKKPIYRTITQNGFLAITAAILLVIVSLIMVVFSDLVTSSGRASLLDLESAQSFGIAEGGLEVGLLKARQGDTTCTIGTTINNSVGEGGYSVTTFGFTPTGFTLTSDITDTSTIVPVTVPGGSDINDFAKSGQITIDNEIISYSGVGATDAACLGETAPCFLSVSRNTYNSTAVSHTAGADIAQTQKFLWSNGSVPSVANPRATRVVGRPFFTPSDIFAVGELSSTVLHHNYCDIWDQTTVTTFTDPLNAVVCRTDNNDLSHCWAVGDNADDIIRWTGVDWEVMDLSGLGFGGDMYSVDCGTSDNCWIVGDDPDIALAWSGSDWSNSGNWSTQGLPNQFKGSLRDVSCNSATHCMAVGTDKNANAPEAINYNGTWNLTNIPGNTYKEPLNGVFCNSDTDCWAVGEDNNQVINWNGSSWSKTNVTYNGTLNDVTCVNSSDCWAVGELTTTVLHYNGSTWSTVSIPAGYGSALNDVHCCSSDKCYAVGDKSSEILEWDGSSWSVVSTGYAGQLNSIFQLGNECPVTYRAGAWREKIQ